MNRAPRRFRPATGAVALVACVALAGCTSNHPAHGQAAASSIAQQASSSAPGSATALSSPPAVAATSPVGSSASSPAPSPSHAPTPTPTASHNTAAAPPARPAAPAPKPPAPPPLLVQQLASVGNAQQVVTVTSTNWSTDVATLQTFEKDAGTWHAVFPPMAAHIGLAGFSANKHEGDDKTPTGSYGFGTMFGQRPNPGVKFPYRVADANSVWVDDRAFASPYYNTWQESPALHNNGELLDSPGFATAYAYAVDIAYNTNPVVPGKGSAIFLHVSTGGGTAGCVSIGQSNLLQVLRWLDPARSPLIVMGPDSVIRQY